jgi:hypothetical protein
VLDVDARDTASFDSSNPTVVHDISPTGLTGVVNGNVVYNATTGAWDFGGGNSGASNIDMGPISTDFSGGITVEFLANFGTVDGWERIIDFGDVGASNNIVITRHAGNSNFLVEIWNSGVRVKTLITEDNPIVDNETAHWAITIDSDIDSTLHFYKNGVEIPTNIDGTVYTQGAPYGGLPETTTRNHSYIGRSLWGDPEFAGSITYLRIYNRALTPTEITANITTDSTAAASGGSANHRGDSRAQELAATGFNPTPWLVSITTLLVAGIALRRRSTRTVR